jgi:hypothetical protein
MTTPEKRLIPESKVPLGQDISRGAKWGIAGLLLLVLLVGAGNLLATFELSNSAQAKFAVQQAAQQASGRILEQKLCSTLDRLSALKPPVGPASTNPSRAYEQQLAVTLSQLKPDLGCPN